MPKLRERANHAQQGHHRDAAEQPEHSAKLAVSPDSSGITAERYPKMSQDALAFARQMQANPHVWAVMRDLADK